MHSHLHIGLHFLSYLNGNTNAIVALSTKGYTIPTRLPRDRLKSTLTMTEVQFSAEDNIEETAQRNDADVSNEILEAQQQLSQGDTTRQRYCNCKSLCLNGISVILFAAFLYASVVQYNDPDGTKWSIYYGLLAAIPLLFLLHFFTRIGMTAMIIFAVSLGMIIWSIVMIVLISIDLNNLLGEEKYYADQREEFVFELSGVSLGLVSASYHVIITRYCVKERGEGHEARVDG